MREKNIYFFYSSAFAAENITFHEVNDKCIRAHHCEPVDCLLE